MSVSDVPGGELSVGVLGPLVVSSGGRALRLTTGRLRTTLAVLALSAGRTVSVDRLAEAVWADSPPVAPQRSLQTYVARLRARLGADRFETRPSGYLLRTDPELVDALRFDALLTEAASAAGTEAERASLAEARGLWRGDPFTDVRSDWLEHTVAVGLRERYLTAVERCADIDLAVGRHQDVITELSELTTRYPLRESLWVRLLTALDQADRQAEALERFEDVRKRLADRLGADPGPRLRAVHADLLAARPLAVTDDGPAAPTPRQLPADITGFTGRAEALDALNDLSNGGTTGIAAVTGTAGVGKTTVAVHWAHRAAGEFPDGQLYADLRGFGPSGQITDPAEVLSGFLTACGVPADRIPVDLDGRVGLYRSVLADKRVLVVLDNARDTAQVRPLLPGGPRCAAVVTSRDQLTGLVAAEGARPVLLGLLSAPEARGLLSARLGAPRTETEPEHRDEIIRRCAGLPLALSMAAARAALRPDMTLSALSAQLRDAGDGLDLLDGDDDTTGVRAVFSWSYLAVGPEAARLFRRLGAHSGADVSPAVAAALAGVPRRTAVALLTELERAHLVTTRTGGRYVMHDLLRAYATELAERHDTPRSRRAAVHRLLDHLLHTAHDAARRLHPAKDSYTLDPPVPGSVPETLTGDERMAHWFTVEHGNLLAAVDLAEANGFDGHVWRLARSLSGHLDRRGHWRDQLVVARAAVAAAKRLADSAAQAHACVQLAAASIRLGRHAEARSALDTALGLFRQVDDRTGLARTHLAVGWLWESQGRYAEALQQYAHAEDMYEQAGHRRGRARALNAVSELHIKLGAHGQARSAGEEALGLYRTLEDRDGIAASWDILGRVHHKLAEHSTALRCYERARGLFRELGHTVQEADTLGRIGDTLRATGDLAATRRTWRTALDILDGHGHPDVGDLRGRLAELGPEAP